jgi:hypothetical protein
MNTLVISSRESRIEKSLAIHAFPEVFVYLYSVIKMEKKTATLPVINPHAAGIDRTGAPDRLPRTLGSPRPEQGKRTLLWCVHPGPSAAHRSSAPAWHTSVAMESTGTYWQTLFTLQRAGFSVLLVGGSQTKNVQRGGPCRPQNRLD